MRHAADALYQSIRGLLSALVALALAACGQGPAETESPPATADDTASESVVVYAAYEDKTYLPALFNEFTHETGIVVVVRNGEVPGIVDDVIDSRVEPVADVLITPSAFGMWRVSEEGELRPNYSELVASNVPEWLRDPDKYWLALGYRQAEIVYDAAQVDPTGITAYEDLSAESFRRKLCLSTSALAVNRSVIAMLSLKLGRRDAELAVRGWVANLALPPFETEAALVQAIARGECAVGIASSGTTAGTRLGVLVPEAAYVDIEAVGVTRHANNPDGAFELVDWLVGAQVQQRHAAQTALLPVSTDATASHYVLQVAAGTEEATKLAERARYR
ncbi:MAG: extracellular solute-binding protein [Woeseiaceae bacterium]